MEESIRAILPILASMIAGYLFGKMLSEAARGACVRLIGLLVMLLLFTVGAEFGRVFETSTGASRTILYALLFAALTTGVPTLIVALLLGKEYRQSAPKHGKRRSAPVMRTIKECVTALMMVALGATTSLVPVLSDTPTWSKATSILLYALILMIGVDLSALKPDRSWWTRKMLVVPLIVVIGSLIGGWIAALTLHVDTNIALALSSGFGWFSLSGALISRFLGPDYGAVALMTDLFRELLAILFLYVFGRNLPALGIAASGAAAMDSTLPIIRQTCQPSDIPVALVSGLILTLLAPFLIALFAS